MFCSIRAAARCAVRGSSFFLRMEAQKRPVFQLDRCAAPQRKKAFQVPKASELATWKATARAPSDVSRLLDVGYAFGIDIETHDWVEHRATKASIGQYGFTRTCY